MLRALHIAVKDVRIWVRDISALGVLLGMPVVLIMILGSALGGMGSTAEIPVAIVNLDTPVTVPFPGEPPTSSRGMQLALGRELTDGLTSSDRLAGVFDIEVVDDEQEVRGRVANGDLAAALIVPAGFSKRVNAGEPVAFQVIKDPGADMSAGIWESVVRSYAVRYSAVSVAVQSAFKAAETYHPALIATPEGQGMLQGRVVQAADDSGLESVSVADSEAEATTDFQALDFFGVTMTAMFLTFGAMFGAFSQIRERREQTLARTLAAPVSPLSVTGGKMLGVFVLGMLQFAVLYGFTRFLFRVDWGADWGATLLVAAAEVAAVTGLAVLIAAFATTERGAGGLGPLVIQIQALMGGAFFTISVLPEWMQPIRYASIIGWAIEGWQEIQLRGGGVGDVLVPVAAMLGFAVLFFAVGSWRMGVRG